MEKKKMEKMTVGKKAVEKKKKVRILLRVSSGRQLDEDGDLSVQRRLVREFVENHEEWELDEKEYFEGGVSGYRNPVERRENLGMALADAARGEFQILAAYKDDRVGRRLWEIGAFIMSLKRLGVEVWTAKDGCISPGEDDVMGQMLLALRYGNAQKSSADTGMRVRDTGKKLAAEGKFMGGTAPYGYELVLSGEVSRNGRALHCLKIHSVQAGMVRKIYRMYLYGGLGDGGIAGKLNGEKESREDASQKEWKSGTVAAILTNPVYTGRMAYGRRERKEGQCRRTEREQWILSDHENPAIRIISGEEWEQVQQLRRERAATYRGQGKKGNNPSMKPEFPLAGILCCGFCGTPLVGTKRSRQRKADCRDKGEKFYLRAYRCSRAKQGIPHPGRTTYGAEVLEEIITDCVAQLLDVYIGKEDLAKALMEGMLLRRQEWEEEWEAECRKLENICRSKMQWEDLLRKEEREKVGFSPERLYRVLEVLEEQEKEQKEKLRQVKKEEELFISRAENRLAEVISPGKLFKEADKSVKGMIFRYILYKIWLEGAEILVELRPGFSIL